jgi:5-methylcytosine-specific restriction protein B
MADHYFNKSADLLFSRFKESHRAWAQMVIDELKRRFPKADHWTTGGEAFKYIDIRIGNKTVGKKSGLPVFYIQQGPTFTGPASLLVNKYSLASGVVEGIKYDSAPNHADVSAWLDALKLSDEGRKRLAGTRKSPVDYSDADNANEEQAPGTDEPMSEEDPVAVSPQALNRILYGPPGTGKTYRTTREALGIIEGTLEPAGNFDAQKLRFDALRREGRIAFVTFHQSFSYEDFVEGIRAEAVSGQLSYKVRDGIFKRMAIAAMYRQPASPTPGRALDFDTLHDAFMAEVEASLPYPVTSSTGSELAIVGVNSKGTFQVTHANRTLRHSVSRTRLKALYEAYPDMGALREKNVVEAITSVIGSCNYTVYWGVLSGLLAFEKKAKTELEEASDEVLQINEPLEYEQIKRRVLTGDILEPNGEPYVLIIDEINRGNMSRIFGELITLIETSKRAGGQETAEVQLPYSNERFSVPDNLYVIGTMNTADRSLAVVDTALRRRFDFIEMMPDLSALAQKNVGGVDIAHMLHAINLRIEQLYDREHTIGHAFFMGLAHNATIADLARIFKNNVLPLLEEYFYEDWEKIDKVLGNCGIYTIQQPGNLGFVHKATTWRRDEGRLMLPETYQRIYASVEARLNTPAASSNG